MNRHIKLLPEEPSKVSNGWMKDNQKTLYEKESGSLRSTSTRSKLLLRSSIHRSGAIITCYTLPIDAISALKGVPLLRLPRNGYPYY